MNWKELWMTLFGTCDWLGLNMGFWVSMAAVLLIVILMSVVFWGIKPKNKKQYIEIDETDLLDSYQFIMFIEKDI